MTLDGTRTYLVGLNDVAVIDPGPDEPAHLDGICSAVADARSKTVVLTHAHPDHAGGAVRLATRIGAPIRMARGALHSPVPDSAVARWVADGDRIETDAGVLDVVAAPGHTPEHVALLWYGGSAPGGGAVFVGDLMMGEGDTALVAHPEGDLAAYLRSLDRVDALGAEVLYPTHGPPLRDPGAAIERYREHRRKRIEQVRAALRTGAAPVAVLADRVYGREVPAALRAAAEDSLRAVLRYLAERGEVRGAEDEYALVQR
jgi:glyoxylase-like metal-dependent hydrolase (beta-lactamase superfamily II)